MRIATGQHFRSIHRFSSTTAKQRDIATNKNANHTKLVKTLYRNLLRSCAQAEKLTDHTSAPIPLDPIPPPVTLLPYSNVDVYMLSDLVEFLQHQKDAKNGITKKKKDEFNDEHWKQIAHIASLLSSESTVETNRLTLRIKKLESIRKSIQVAFRLSGNVMDDKTAQNHVTMAFDTLRNLREHIQPMLHRRFKERQLHMSREGISFRVGQVVKHKSQKWRGVIFGWKHIDDVTNDVGLNFTQDQEQYAKDLGALYSILVDSMDLVRLQQDNDSITDNPIQHIPQCDLEPISNERLNRIRNPLLATKFDRLDIGSKSLQYVPRPSLDYEFPFDPQTLSNNKDASHQISDKMNKAFESSMQTIRGVQLLALHFKNTIQSNFTDDLETITSSSSTSLPILDSMIEQLDEILLECLDYENKTIIQSKSSSSRVQMDAARVLADLNEFMVHVLNSASYRRQAMEHLPHMKYRIGSIVREKNHGLRCVITGCTFPVVRTEKNDSQMPKSSPTYFYHLKPDMNDVSQYMKAKGNNMNPFGFDRIIYANEHHLNLCSMEETKYGLNVDLGSDDWKLFKEDKVCRYDPPDEIKFEYGEVLTHQDVISDLMETLKKEILTVQHLIQINSITDDPKTTHINDIVSNLSLDNLFVMLRTCDNVDSSKNVEDFIQEIWKSHPDVSARERFDDGLNHLFHGDSKDALEIFNSLIYDFPDYFEVWNKIATGNFLLGSMEESLSATEKTLSFEPRHFPALAGLGLIKQTQGDQDGAIKAYSECLDFSPWSIVSSRLSACLDQDKDSNADSKLGNSDNATPFEIKGIK